MDNFEPNSHKHKESQEEKKVIAPVVSGKAEKKKKSEWSKFKDQLISEDAPNMKTYLVTDVLIPAIKKTFVDLVKQAVDILVYGRNASKTTSTASKVSYRSYYSEPRSPDKPKGILDYDELTFETKADAETVLMALKDIIDQFGIAKIGDLYELSNVTFTDYTVNSYGWKDLNTASVIRYGDRYLLRLPRALPIN